MEGLVRWSEDLPIMVASVCLMLRRFRLYFCVCPEYVPERKGGCGLPTVRYAGTLPLTVCKRCCTCYRNQIKIGIVLKKVLRSSPSFTFLCCFRICEYRKYSMFTDCMYLYINLNLRSRSFRRWKIF
jgi:hypothetical protein